MREIKCGNCEKSITNKTEVEYSEWLSEFFCDPDCATTRYFDFMGSTPFYFEDYGMRKDGLLLKKGKLFQKD